MLPSRDVRTSYKTSVFPLELATNWPASLPNRGNRFNLVVVVLILETSYAIIDTKKRKEIK